MMPVLNISAFQDASTLCVESPVDFSARFAEIRSYASCVAGQVAEDSEIELIEYRDQNGNPLPDPTMPGANSRLVLTSGKTNVLNTTFSQVSAVQNITFQPLTPDSNTPVVINIDGEGMSSFDWDVWTQNLSGAHAPFVLYNVFNVDQVIVTGAQSLEGSFYAPNSKVIDEGSGNIEGNVIVREFEHSGGEVHDFPLEFEVDNCVGVTNSVVSVGSTVFSDVNNNGTQDAAESGIANVTVQLFSDLGVEVNVGLDGILGTADDAAGGMPTDGSGLYFFQDLAPGNYEVRIPASNFTVGNALANLATSSTDIATTPNTDGTGVDEDDNGLQAGGSGTQVVSPIINLAVGAETGAETDVGGSGGDVQDDANEADVSGLVSLGSRVWYDNNQNGIQDISEPGVNGITVNLYDNSSCTAPFVASTVTATAGATPSDGYYGFLNLMPGDFCIEFIGLPIDFIFTSQDVGGDDAIDSDVDASQYRSNTGYCLSG